jgi:nucleotide-binding universal stress UspA family protein
MTEHSRVPVVVAVGQDPMDAALSFGAAEAAMEGCPLHLVHVVHSPPRGPDAALFDERDLERAGREALNTALERARELVAAESSVTAELHFGQVVPTLSELAAGAQMMVLQRRDLSSLRRVVTRSVSSGVAAHARVPVVSVPEKWSAGGGSDRTAAVTVGMDVPERSLEVLRAGAAAAARRGAVLHILHAWSFPAAYADIPITDEELEEWQQRAAAEVQPVIDALGDGLPGVPYRVEVRRTPVADALVRASGSSDLLVIGRHDSHVPLGSHLGPVARAVLREAECPVLLVDPRPAVEEVSDERPESLNQTA